MKKSYSALSTVSKIFTVLGYMVIFVGLWFCLFVLSLPAKEGEPNYTIIFLIGTIFTTFLTSITFWGASQFIKLWIDIATDIHNINENAFYIADLIAKKDA